MVKALGTTPFAIAGTFIKSFNDCVRAVLGPRGLALGPLDFVSRVVYTPN